MYKKTLTLRKNPLRMGKVNTPYYIARRIAAEKGGRSNVVMVRVAVASISIGLAVMIFSLAIVFGFKKEIAEKLTGVMSHVQIVHFGSSGAFETEPISSDQPFLHEIEQLPGFRHISRYAIKPGLLRGEESMHGIVLKGVGPEYDWDYLRRNLRRGKLPEVGDSVRKKEVLISDRVASLMSLDTGSRIEFMFIQENPRRDAYVVSGIYHTDLQEIDQVLMFTDIRNVQRINDWGPDEVSGFEIMSDDFRGIEAFSEEVYRVLNGMSDRIRGRLMVTDLKESNPMIFDWLDTHDLNALILIVVLLMVAVFNIIAALLIILLEKTSMIGILKTLGMQNSSVQKIFLYRSGYIVLTGMLIGNLVGLLLCWVQQRTGLLKLDADGYFLSQIPIAVRWGYWALLNAGVFVVSLALLVIPTSVVSRITPVKTIRFD